MSTTPGRRLRLVVSLALHFSMGGLSALAASSGPDKLVVLTFDDSVASHHTQSQPRSAIRNPGPNPESQKANPIQIQSKT